MLLTKYFILRCDGFFIVVELSLWIFSHGIESARWQITHSTMNDDEPIRILFFPSLLSSQIIIIIIVIILISFHVH